MGDLLGIALFGLFLVYPVYWIVRERNRRRADHEAITLRSLKGALDSAIEDDAREATALWVKYRDAFPFLPKPEPENLSGDAIRAAVRKVLSAWEVFGSFNRGLSAPALPSSERLRHLYICGKTGSGKSTLLEHLVNRDLRAGRGVGLIAPEGELFQRLLALVPRARLEDVIYLAPGNPESPIAFNPLLVEEGEDRAKAAEDLYTIFKRTLGSEMGARMEPILQNAFAALVGRQGSTFFDVRRLLTDPLFRTTVARDADAYVRSFLTETYAQFPKGAELPLLTRLDQFLRPPSVRRTLSSPRSSFSIREVLSDGKILFVDLSGLSEESRLLIGQMVLSKFQLELLRRERTEAKLSPFFLYCDEFQSFAGLSEGVWRELLSRGRKYGLALTLANQYPGQLSPALQAEIFGNVNSLISFALGRKDADIVRKELLRKVVKKDEERIEPVAAEELLELPVGEAVAKFAGGRAVRFFVPSPLETREPERAKRALAASWAHYGVSAVEEALPATSPVAEPESFLE
jgi:cbb3-type cytochrome oxidase subunit 3